VLQCVAVCCSVLQPESSPQMHFYETNSSGLMRSDTNKFYGIYILRVEDAIFFVGGCQGRVFVESVI